MYKEDIFLGLGFTSLIASLILAKLGIPDAAVMTVFIIGCASICVSFFVLR